MVVNGDHLKKANVNNNEIYCDDTSNNNNNKCNDKFPNGIKLEDVCTNVTNFIEPKYKSLYERYNNATYVFRESRCYEDRPVKFNPPYSGKSVDQYKTFTLDILKTENMEYTSNRKLRERCSLGAKRRKYFKIYCNVRVVCRCHCDNPAVLIASVS